MSYGILAAHEMQWSTMSQLARVVELLLQLPQQAPAARLCCHVLRSCLVGAALIACADKAEGTHGGDGQGSEVPHERSSGHGGDAGASPVPSEAATHPGMDSSTGGGSSEGKGQQAAAAAMLALASAEDRPSGRFDATTLGALEVDDHEGTQVGSPPDGAKRLRRSEARPMWVVQGTGDRYVEEVRAGVNASVREGRAQGED